MLAVGWFDVQTGQARPGAFLRKPKDEVGISVGIAAQCPISEFVDGFSTCYGVFTLHVGRIRNLGLDILPDPLRHANIIGLPFQNENQAEAERLAGKLAKQARPLWAHLKARPKKH